MLNDVNFSDFNDITRNSGWNKPERVFVLYVRYRELDIFKILEFFLDFFGNFFGNFLEFFWNFFGNFGGILLQDFFGGILLAEFVFEEFFERNFLWGFSLGGRIFLGGFFGRIFGRNSLAGILCLHWNWLVCHDFVFFSRFFLNKEGGRKDKNLDP